MQNIQKMPHTKPALAHQKFPEKVDQLYVHRPKRHCINVGWPTHRINAVSIPIGKKNRKLQLALVEARFPTASILVHLAGKV